MLFGYPVAAIAENWLHDSLCEMLGSIHMSIQAGQNPPAWPGIIPAQHRPQLSSRTGIQERLVEYTNAFRALTPQEQTQVIRALDEQNEIANLAANRSNCERLSDLPDAIQISLRSLFDFAFKLLTDLQVRDTYYSAILEGIPYRVCPYCGCEYFDEVGVRREALDHFLPISIYPFAGCNLRNLSPMGNKCNFYKSNDDVLYDRAKNRRCSFDPYQSTGIKVLLKNSVPFAGVRNRPRWEIEFENETEEIRTWEEIFRIRERYGSSLLDARFNTWMTQFARWCKRSRSVNNDQDLVDALKEHELNLEDDGFDGQAFLTLAVFQMLRSYCEQGDVRVIKFLKDLLA